jgi:hypothetical protein
MEWVLRQVSRFGGFRVVAKKFFPMALTAASLRSQISFARTEAEHVGDDTLRRAVLEKAARLQAQIDTMKTHRGAKKYAVVLERL